MLWLRRCLIVLIALSFSGMARAEVLVRIADLDAMSINALAELDGEIFIATNRGVARVEGNRAVEVFDEPASATILAVVRRRMWVGTERGLFKIDGDRPSQVLADPVQVTALLEADGIVWLGTRQGLHQVMGETLSAQLLPEEGGVEILKRASDGTLWVGAASGAYRIDVPSGEPTRVLQGQVSGIFEAGGDVWLIMSPPSRGGYSSSCFRVVKGSAAPQEVSVPAPVVTVADLWDGVWFGTRAGAFRFREGDSPVGPLGKIQKTINAIVEADGDAWLGTAGNGAYKIYSNGKQEAVLEGLRQPLKVVAIHQLNGQLWLHAFDSVYRRDENVNILVEYRLLLSRIQIGDRLPVRYERYDRDGRDAYGPDVPTEFMAVVGFNEESFRRKLTKNDYQTVDDLTLPKPWGFVRLYVRVRDGFGNVFNIPGKRVLVLPVESKILPFWWFLAATILFMAPWYPFAMGLVMNRWVRRVASLAAMPVFLSLQFFRLHLLKGYRDAILRSDFFLPSPGDSVLETLEGALKNTGVLVLRRADAEACLLGLTRQIAADKVHALEHHVPIFLPLNAFANAGEDLIEAAADQLEGIGGITDRDLARKLLNVLTCAYLLPNLEMLDETRDQGRLQALRKFIVTHQHRNLIIVGTAGPGGLDNHEVIS